MIEEMMTLEELQKTDINIDIIREALNQSEKMMYDLLKTKDGINQKSFLLFNWYITIITGLAVASFIIAQNNINSYLLFFLIPLCFFFMGSALFFMFSFRGFKYGTIGNSPSFWLRKDTISGNEKTMATVLSYLVYSYEGGTKQSHESNIRKTILQHSGIYLSITGIIISFILSLLSHLSNPYIHTLTALLSVSAIVVLAIAVVCYLITKHFLRKN
jgi:hypothetical protein